MTAKYNFTIKKRKLMLKDMSALQMQNNENLFSPGVWTIDEYKAIESVRNYCLNKLFKSSREV